MNPVFVLRKDHEVIEVELSELDFIMSPDEEGDINYPNLVHTFWKLCNLWDNHEEMEEDIFKVMKEEDFEIPIEIVLTEHKSLQERVKKINDAINSGSDFNVRKALSKEMRELVDILREHMKKEDEALTGVILSNFTKEGLEKIKFIVGRYQE